MDGSRVWFTVHGIRCTRVRGTGMRYTVRTRYMILSVQGTHTRYATRYRYTVYTVYRHVHDSRYTAHRSRVCFTVSVDGSQSVHGEPQQTHVCMEIYSPSSTPPRLQVKHSPQWQMLVGWVGSPSYVTNSIKPGKAAWPN